MNLRIAATAALLGTLLNAQDPVAIKAGRVITMAGDDLENVVILVENGRIHEIGAGVELPWQARVIDASDKVVLPAYVLAHSSGGLRSANENLANVPYLSVADGVDPSSNFFAEALRNGVGTVHVIQGDDTLVGGTGIVVKPFGRTVEDMTVLTRTGLKLSLKSGGNTSVVAKIRQMRRALDEVRDYLADYERRKQEFEQEKEAGAIPADKTWDEKIDPKKRPVVDLLNGKARAHLFVPGPPELREAFNLMQRYDIAFDLVLGPGCHEAVRMFDRLKERGVMLTHAMEDEVPIPDSDDEKVVCLAYELAKAGVPMAFDISTSISGPQRYPWWQMAIAIRHGVGERTALAAFTTVPARLLGLQDQLGTLEKGKLANIQIVTGDPLRADSWVDTVLLEGEVVYERAADTRLQHLFGAADGAAEGGR